MNYPSTETKSQTAATLTVYKASAGTGKTFTLTVQYIKNLISEPDGSEYRHILAVTFTNKATAEMKDRILEQLYGISKGLESSSGYLTKIKEELERDGNGLSTEVIRKRAGIALHQILHDFSRFRVETIDSFFQSVLKNLAHELNLTANLRVELNEKEVLDEAVERIMDRLHLTPRILSWILDYVNEMIENDKNWNISKEVKLFGKSIFHKAYLTHQEKLQDISKSSELLRRILQEEQMRVKDQLKSAAVHFEEEMQTLGIDYSAFCYGNDIASYVRKILAEDRTAEAKSRLLGFMQQPEKMLRATDKKKPALMQLAQHFSTLLTELYQFQQEEITTVNSAMLTLKYLNPLRLLSEIDREVTAVSEENGSFLLSKTPILLNELMDESDAPFIFEKIGTFFRHIMIDEFQDTSTLQWKNFKVLLKETMSSGNSNLIVGDTKQSIYRWRNGDWTILQHIKEEFPHHPIQIESLSTNYRSESRIISFNNYFFERSAHLLDLLDANAPDELQDLYIEKDEQGMTRYQKCSKKEEHGLVDIRLLSNKDEWEKMMLDELCQKVKELSGKGVEWKDMAIILRQKDHIIPIMKAFSDDEELRSVNLISDEAFLLENSLAIQLIINSLRCLSDPKDTISQAFIAAHCPAVAGGAALDNLYHHDMAHLLPSFLTDDRERLCNMPLYELQEELYRLLQLEELEGEDMYLSTYFDTVSEYLQDAPSSIKVFLKAWDENLHSKHTPANPVNGIRVVTIHASKGLEFPTVFIPYNNWSIERDRLSNTLWCEPTQKPYDLLPVIPISEQGSMASSCFADEYEEEHLKKRIDALNLLYVAFTRPKSNLYVWATRRKEKLGRASIIGNLIAEALPTDLKGAQIDTDAEGNVTHYTYGELHLEKAVKETNDNRMKITYDDLDFRIKTRQPDITFCQSYQAEEFLQVLATTDNEGYHENDQRLLGIALHKTLSSVHSKNDMEKALLQLETEGYISTLKEKELLIRKVEHALKDPETGKWFDGSMELYNECPIISKEYNAAKSKYESYRPDRVMMDDDCIIVVDFKTGSHHHKANAQKNKEQVHNYMRQLHLMEPHKEITGYIWYILENYKEAITLE